MVALTKALARENGPSIRANVIAPGAVHTEFLAGGTGRPAQPLGIAAGAPLVRLQQVVYDARDRPVEHVTARDRGDRCEYRAVLRRESGQPGWAL